jgi:hypothetical protein
MIPCGPALITVVSPKRSIWPALAWMCPQITRSGFLAISVSLKAVLPRRLPSEEISSAPLGGEWLISTPPGGQFFSKCEASSSLKS